MESTLPAGAWENPSRDEDECRTRTREHDVHDGKVRDAPGDCRRRRRRERPRSTAAPPWMAGVRPSSVRASRPTAWSAHSPAHLVDADLDATPPGFFLPGRCDPTDPLIARQRSNVAPELPRRDVGLDGLPEVTGQLVHRATRDLASSHGDTQRLSWARRLSTHCVEFLSFTAALQRRVRWPAESHFPTRRTQFRRLSRHRPTRQGRCR